MQEVMNTAKKTTTILWTALFTMALVSCDLLLGSPSKPTDNLEILNAGEFYAQNLETGKDYGKYYKVKADKLFEGAQCVIWAEKDAGVTQLQAQKIADEYDGKIRPTVVDTFSKKNFTYPYAGRTYRFNDMLDYANWLVGRDDKKLTILLLDIKDGFKDPKTDSYVAGYFFFGNFYSAGNIEQNGKRTEHYSNGRDMIYVDTYPGLQVKPEQTYATFAHELQHLVNFVTSVQMDKPRMDTWIDEGLSSQAEHLYLGRNAEEKIDWFCEDPEGTIAKGNNFFVWGNYPGNSILDEYATVYLFFRWLYLQADTAQKASIFHDIITADNVDYRAVTNVAKEINPEWNEWEPLLRTWLAANYSPKSSYGYAGDVELREMIKVNPIGGTSIALYPGEGVYSIINNPFTPSLNPTNIRYENLGNALLTFNASTVNSGTILRETGSLTGVPPPSPASSSRTIGESRQTKTITGPYVIDAQDVLGRDKW
jgi:hypothetical protein